MRFLEALNQDGFQTHNSKSLCQNPTVVLYGDHVGRA